MSVANGEIVKLVAEFLLVDGTIAQNIFHFLATFIADQSDGDVLDACAQYIQDIYDSIDSRIDENTDVNLATAHVVEFDGVDEIWETVRLIGTVLPAMTFTGATDPLPNQIAPVLIANTLRPKTRGRKFLLPLLESATWGSEWQSATITDLVTSLNHFIADETVTASNVLSPGVPRAGVADFQEFTNGSVNSIVGTQRRRKPGVGT